MVLQKLAPVIRFLIFYRIAAVAATSENESPRSRTEFDGRADGIIKVWEKEAAYLPCELRNVPSDSTVSWIRDRDLRILTVGNFVYTKDKRISLKHFRAGTAGDWTLKIDRAALNDSGKYECQVNSQPMRIFAVHLVVKVIDEYSDDFRPLHEKVNGPSKEIVLGRFTSDEKIASVKILQGSTAYIALGGAINLTCEVAVASNKKAWKNFERNLMWLHDAKVITENTSHYGTYIATKEYGKIIRSHLYIAQSLASDAGEYACRPHQNHMVKIQIHLTNGAGSILYRTSNRIPELLNFIFICWFYHKNFLRWQLCFS